MNSKAVKIMGELALCLVLGLTLSFVPQASLPFLLDLSLIPLFFFSIRRGAIWGAIGGFLLGLGNFFLHSWGTSPILVGFHDWILSGIFLFLAGLFARNTVRTAFNVRLSSTILNITTAALFVSIANWGFHAIAASLGQPSFYQSQEIALGQSSALTWLNAVVTFVVTSLVTIALLYIRRSLFVPKGTPYLSRREQSHLLND